jgi:hypothetical protein
MLITTNGGGLPTKSTSTINRFGALTLILLMMMSEQTAEPSPCTRTAGFAVRRRGAKRYAVQFKEVMLQMRTLRPGRPLIVHKVALSTVVALSLSMAACISSEGPSGPLLLATGTPVRQVYVADLIVSNALLLDFDYDPSVRNPQAQERFMQFHEAALAAVRREFTERGYDVLGLRAGYFQQVSSCHALGDLSDVLRWAREQRPTGVPSGAAIATILLCVQYESADDEIPTFGQEYLSKTFSAAAVVDDWQAQGKPKGLWSSDSGTACQWDTAEGPLLTKERRASEEQENRDILHECIRKLIPALFVGLPHSQGAALND